MTIRTALLLILSAGSASICRGAESPRKIILRSIGPHSQSPLCPIGFNEIARTTNFSSFSLSAEQRRLLEAPAFHFGPKAGAVDASRRTSAPAHLGDSTSGRVLYTQDIDPHLLPRIGDLRPTTPTRQEIDLVLEDVKSQIIKREGSLFIAPEHTDIHLRSRNRPPASKSIAKLAYLNDGTPVAIKTPIGTNSAAECLSAVLLSELGIGPKFRGMIIDGKTLSYAMELIPGDFAQANSMNIGTLIQREKIIRRLSDLNIVHEDYQDLLTPSGELRVIDADKYYEFYRADRKLADNYLLRSALLRVIFSDAPIEESQKYLLDLRLRDPEFFKVVKDYYRRMRNPTYDDANRTIVLQGLLIDPE